MGRTWRFFSLEHLGGAASSLECSGEEVPWAAKATAARSLPAQSPALSPDTAGSRSPLPDLQQGWEWCISMPTRLSIGSDHACRCK